MWILHYWEGWWHEVGMMFPLGRLLETHHHWQVSMVGYRSTNQFHYLNRGGVLEVQFTSARFKDLKTARSLLTIINSDHQPLGQGTPRIGFPILSSPRVGCGDRQLSAGPSGCWFPSGSDRKRFSSWIPPPATGPHSDCSRGRFLVLADHYNHTVLIWGVLNYPVHPKWTVWMHTRRNCAVREGSKQCWHHIK